MNPSVVLAVATGGALGSVARYAVGVASVRLLGSGFPWGTLFINVLGSFVIGALAEAFALRWDASQATRAFWTVGICGGFTTFSTFSLDFAGLASRGASLPALLYVAASVVLGIGALYLAMGLARAMLAP
jgi:CrcB protein